jgi:hypothetical protein
VLDRVLNFGSVLVLALAGVAVVRNLSDLVATRGWRGR